jgi:hypothetical protein
MNSTFIITLLNGHFFVFVSVSILSNFYSLSPAKTETQFSLYYFNLTKVMLLSLLNR